MTISCRGVSDAIFFLGVSVMHSERPGVSGAERTFHSAHKLGEAGAECIVYSTSEGTFLAEVHHNGKKISQYHSSSAEMVRKMACESGGHTES